MELERHTRWLEEKQLVERLYIVLIVFHYAEGK